MLPETKKINLDIPRSWNGCSLPQLRAIADVMDDCSLRSDRFHPFDMMEVKVGVFFRLANIEVVEPLNPRVPVEEQYYTCRLRPYTLDDEQKRLFRMLRYYRSLKAWCKRNILGLDDTFALYLWQINFWLTPHKSNINGKQIPGLLDWLNADNKAALLRFPFSTLFRKRSLWGRTVEFHGPNAFMDGFSWRRYRFAQDYMQMYADQHNHLLQLQQMGSRVSPTDILKAWRSMDLAKALFLATIFNRRITYIDENTGKAKTDYHYQSNQHSDNSPFFRNFSDRDWQLVTLWWQGMMHWLHKTYPKVFKMQPVKGQKKQVNPLELYTRTTATLEKYLHATAADIDREPYTTILQQLEDITHRNEEVERMNRKMKSNRKK